MGEIKVNDIIEFGTYPQTKEGDTFKVESIKWRVLEINNGEALILSEKILDTHMFSEEINNYADSEIRRWLNNEFYNKAFNEEEKSRIVVTNVDNTEKSTNPNDDSKFWNDGKNEYVCENTNDKIFLLSEQEATKKEYGFDADIRVEDLNRQKQGTDYAKSQGLDDGWWWLRSPDCDDSDDTHNVDSIGKAYSNYHVDISLILGVVPALKIKLI